MKERLTKEYFKRLARTHYLKDGPNDEVQGSNPKLLEQKLKKELTFGSEVYLHTEEKTPLLEMFRLTQNGVAFGMTNLMAGEPTYLRGPFKFKLFSQDQNIYATISPANSEPMQIRIVAIQILNSQGLRSLTLKEAPIAV